MLILLPCLLDDLYELGYVGLRNTSIIVPHTSIDLIPITDTVPDPCGQSVPPFLPWLIFGSAFCITQQMCQALLVPASMFKKGCFVVTHQSTVIKLNGRTLHSFVSLFPAALVQYPTIFRCRNDDCRLLAVCPAKSKVRMQDI